MNTTVNPKRGRLALGAALLALLAGALALPSAASAAATDNTVCKGSVTKGEKSVDFDNPLAYKLACSNYISSYSLIFPGRTIDTVETEVFGLDATTNNVLPTDSFSCNGDIPGYGINCVGTYTGAFHTLPGLVNISGDVCDPTAGNVYAVVSYASVATNDDGTTKLTNGKATLTTNTAGPFNLGKVKGCTTSTKATAKAKVKAKS